MGLFPTFPLLLALNGGFFVRAIGIHATHMIRDSGILNRESLNPDPLVLPPLRDGRVHREKVSH